MQGALKRSKIRFTSAAGDFFGMLASKMLRTPLECVEKHSKNNIKLHSWRVRTQNFLACGGHKSLAVFMLLLFGSPGFTRHRYLTMFSDPMLNFLFSIFYFSDLQSALKRSKMRFSVRCGRRKTYRNRVFRKNSGYYPPLFSTSSPQGGGIT